MSRDDTPTLTQCLACDGHWKVSEQTGVSYRETICKWCTTGAMTREQIVAWHNHRITARTKVKR